MRKSISVFLAVLFAALFITPYASAISARSFAVINGDTGKLIYSSNANERLPMASTTKIMTALLLCKDANLDKKVTVTRQMIAVEGSSMGLMAGDIITNRDLLYGMMLPSGNDAANVAAYSVSGSSEKFVELMNAQAQELGLQNTHFNTPSGLDGESHYTTAFELALIAKAAFEYTDFADAVKCKTKTVNVGGNERKIYLSNHNRLLSLYGDAVGVKTGFTKKAGRCLVSAARRDGRFVIAVTLNDGNDWNDHKRLLDIGLFSLQEKKIGKSVYCIKVAGGDVCETRVSVQGFAAGLTKDEELVRKVNLPDVLFAPVRKGDKIGTAQYFADGNLLVTRDIVAAEDVDVKQTSFIKKFIYNFKYILSKI